MNSVGTNNSTSSEATQALAIKIFGEPASKANSRKMVRFGGMSRLIKSQKALDYAAQFKQQATPIHPLIEDDVKVDMVIYYASRRPDLDESLILDLLQGVVYVNDRQVKEKHIVWGLDKDNPRTEIVVSVLPKKSPAGQGRASSRRTAK